MSTRNGADGGVHRYDPAEWNADAVGGGGIADKYVFTAEDQCRGQKNIHLDIKSLTLADQGTYSFYCPDKREQLCLNQAFLVHFFDYHQLKKKPRNRVLAKIS